MTTYELCERVIRNNQNKLNEEKYETFKTGMYDKLDVFLLNNRIDIDEYKLLIDLLEKK